VPNKKNPEVHVGVWSTPMPYNAPSRGNDESLGAPQWCSTFLNILFDMPSSGGMVSDSNALRRDELSSWDTVSSGHKDPIMWQGGKCVSLGSGCLTGCFCSCLNFATASGGHIKTGAKQRLFTLFSEMFINNFCFGKLFVILFTSCFSHCEHPY